MTYRELMEQNDENLSWCAPRSFMGGRIVAAVNDGKIVGLQIDRAEVPCNEESIRVAAKMANVDYDSYSGWSDAHILLDADNCEMPCRLCPWFGVCDAMDEETA